MSGKRKGGAEKVREKKVLLLNASEKCLKINDMFSKLKNTPSTSKSDTDSMGEFKRTIGKF